jgi:hypothetical protein
MENRSLDFASLSLGFARDDGAGCASLGMTGRLIRRPDRSEAEWRDLLSITSR